jgi:hypothetical protein
MAVERTGIAASISNKGATDVEEPTAYVIRLTAEELTALYKLSTLPSAEIPYSDLLPQYSAEQREVAIEVARRSLIVRQLLVPNDDGELELHPLALAVVGGALLAKRSLVVRTQSSTGEVESRDFRTYGNEVYLAHVEQPDDLHEFAIFADTASFGQAIQSALAMAAPTGLSGHSGTLPSALFSRAIALAREENRGGIAATLGQSSLPQETAEALAATLSGPHTLKAFEVRDRATEPAEPQQTTVFVQGDGALWLLETVPDSGEEELLSVQTLSATEFQQKVQAIADFG